MTPREKDIRFYSFVAGIVTGCIVLAVLVLLDLMTKGTW